MQLISLDDYTIELLNELKIEIVSEVPENDFVLYEKSAYIDEDDDQLEHRGRGYVENIKKLEGPVAFISVSPIRILLADTVRELPSLVEYDHYRSRDQLPVLYLKFPSIEVKINFFENKDDGDFPSSFYSEQQYNELMEKRAREKEAKHRRECESLIKSVMKKYKCEVFDSLETVAALYFEMEIEAGKYQSQIEALEEDGLCSGFGITAEQWSDDRNYLRGKRDEVTMSFSELITFLEKEFPLLLAKFEQDKEGQLEKYRSIVFRDGVAV